jgi:hypothetical protein
MQALDRAALDRLDRAVLDRPEMQALDRLEMQALLEARPRGALETAARLERAGRPDRSQALLISGAALATLERAGLQRGRREVLRAPRVGVGRSLRLGSSPS